MGISGNREYYETGYSGTVRPSLLNEVEDRKPAPTKDEVLEVLRDASFGTDPAVSMIEAVEQLYAERGL